MPLEGQELDPRILKSVDETGSMSGRQPLTEEELIRQVTPLEAGDAMLQKSDRITAMCTLYHEHFGEQPVSSEASFSAMLDTDDGEVYMRKRVKVGVDWTDLDTGWVTEPGYVLVTNVTGQGTHLTPTAEQMEVNGKCIVEVGVAGQRCHHISPKRFFVVDCIPQEALQVRCPSGGSAQINIVVFPR